jgi:Flp pilus assembly protein TadD
VPAPPPTRSKTRWIPYAIAAVLTFCISLTFFSRQSMRASQTKAPAATVVQPPPSVPAVAQQVAAPAPQAPAPAAVEAAPATEPAPVKPSEEEVLLGQVKALWASGKYAQAMEKVDDLLTTHPDYMEGRIWKKKIRSAQEAEAAMK